MVTKEIPLRITIFGALSFLKMKFSRMQFSHEHLPEFIFPPKKVKNRALILT